MRHSQLETESPQPIAEQRTTTDNTVHRALRDDLRPIRAAHIALGWVVVFVAFHVYWYLGGSFVSPGKLPGWPHTLAGWTFNVLVAGSFALGFLVPLAISRGWARERLAMPIAIIVWLGCAILILRGGAGLIDDLTRVTGILPNGLTGISTKDATGMAHVTASEWAIESYFLLGGMIFGALAISHRQHRESLRLQNRNEP